MPARPLRGHRPRRPTSRGIGDDAWAVHAKRRSARWRVRLMRAQAIAYTLGDMTEHTTQELIDLGRDREAVAAASRGRPRDGAEQLDAIIPMLEAIVSRITD